MTNSDQIPRFPLIINGSRCEPLNGEYMEVVNPASGEIIAQAAMGSSADLDVAVAAARSAFEDPDWRKMAPTERSSVLYRCAQLMMANVQELALLEVSASCGTKNRITDLDIPAVVDLFMMLAEEVKDYPFVENLPPRILPELCHTQVLKQPIGVVGLITAWNFPLLLFGLKVAPALAASVKRCTLELGGKGPGIVLPDADLDMVAQGALWGVYMNAGQACESGTRLLVHEDVYDTLMDKLAERSAQFIVGDPMSPEIGMGPMTSEAHCNKVLAYIDSATELNVGSVWINDWHMMRTDAPFGGFGQSGHSREFGKYSIDSYVEIKSVSTAFETSPGKKNLHRIVHTQMA